MAVAVEINVPHTGSFFSSPPAWTDGLCGALAGDWNAEAKPFVRIPITDRRKLRNSTATIKYRIPRNMMLELILKLGQGYFFFGDCFLNCVSTVWPMVASIALAESANGPSGRSSRYFWNSSAVPGGGVIFPSAVVVALPIR